MAKCKIIKIPSLKGEKKNLFPQKKKIQLQLQFSQIYNIIISYLLPLSQDKIRIHNLRTFHRFSPYSIHVKWILGVNLPVKIVHHLCRNLKHPNDLVT